MIYKEKRYNDVKNIHIRNNIKKFLIFLLVTIIYH